MVPPEEREAGQAQVPKDGTLGLEGRVRGQEPRILEASRRCQGGEPLEGAQPCPHLECPHETPAGQQAAGLPGTARRHVRVASRCQALGMRREAICTEQEEA